MWSSATVRAEVTIGPITGGPTNGDFTLRPIAGLEGRFGEPGFEVGLVDGDTN